MAKNKKQSTNTQVESKVASGEKTVDPEQINLSPKDPPIIGRKAQKRLLRENR